MNIVVCIKQVPNVAQIKFDSETRTLVREGVTLQLNSLDRRAITQAIRLKEAHGGTVTFITMGPPQAKSALAEAMATGGDRAIHLNDRAFAGSDTLATARTLATAIKKLDYDVIICGRFTNDSETGQVGPEVAELLGVPHATNARTVEYEPVGGKMLVTREIEEGWDKWELDLPCLFTAGEFLILSIRPSAAEVEAAMAQEVEVWTAADLGLLPEEVGLAGSPTSVSEIREMHVDRRQQVVSGANPEQAAGQMVDYLLKEGLYTPWQRSIASLPPRASAAAPGTAQAVWVIPELAQGQIRGVTYELLSKAAELAQRLNSEVAAVLIGNNVSAQAEVLASYGADRVYVADHPDLDHYHTLRYTQVLAEAIASHKPYAVLFPASINGRDLAPRVAARLGLGLTGDCIGLEIDDQQRLVQLKPAFGGNIVAPILTRTTPAMCTVRPGVLDRLAPASGRTAAIEALSLGQWQENHMRHLGLERLPGDEGLALEEAEALVGVGNGVSLPDDLPLFQELAQLVDGSIATTLRVVANGQLPGPLQVGLTGRSVAPRFYITSGISGALNHLIGVQKSEHIVAINNDPEAPIFKSCDFGIIGDYKTLVPAVINQLKAAKAESGRAH